MKIYIFIVLVLLFAVSVNAQIFGTNYTWIETYSVTTDSVDTTFTDPYYQATLFFDGCTGLIKWAGVATGDTVNIAGRPYTLLQPSQTITIGTATKLKRMEYYTSSGTGTLYIVGYKRVRQY